MRARLAGEMVSAAMRLSPGAVAEVYVGAGGLSASYYAASATRRRSGRRSRARGARSASSAPASPGCRRGWSWPSAGTRSWCSRRAKVGWGASGRNGGQIVNGLNAGLDTIERALRARRPPTSSATVVQEGGRIIRERVASYGIACDLKDGNIFTAFTAKQMRELEAKQALWRRHGHRQFRDARPGRAAAACRPATSMSAACSTARGGHMHPLNLALGQAAALERLGGVIHEASPVVGDRGCRRAAGGADGAAARCGRRR